MSQVRSISPSMLPRIGLRSAAPPHRAGPFGLAGLSRCWVGVSKRPVSRYGTGYLKRSSFISTIVYK